LPSRQERFLYPILRVVKRTEDAIAMELKLAAVRGDELPKSLLVPGASPLDEIRGHTLTHLAV
jgi:hypothetical protein